MINIHFGAEVAIEAGVDGAIMLDNLQFWIIKNKANKKHYYDGKYWTYNTMEAFTELFPFWSKRQIERILNNLKNNGYLIDGNYNKTAYDRTKWYALTDRAWLLLFPTCNPNDFNISPNGEMSKLAISPNGEMEKTKCENGNNKTVTPIPDILPYKKTDIVTTQSSVVVPNTNIELIEEKTHLKSMSNNMKKKVVNWNTDRLIKAIDIFIKQDGIYFSLLEKIYKDEKNFISKSNTKASKPPLNHSQAHKRGAGNFKTDSFEDMLQNPNLEKLLLESQKDKF